MLNKVCLFAALLCPGLAQATVTVSSVPSGPSYITYTVTTVSPGVYDVSITRQSYSGDVTVNIRGATSDAIRNVTVASGLAGRNTFFSVRGPNANDPITSIETFVESSGSGYTEITELRTSGDVGNGGTANDAIKVDGWTGGFIAGSVTDKIALTNGQLNNVTVDDGVFGNITVSSSSLIFLEVTNGPIGTVGTPVTINVGGSIHDLKATEIHAAIDTDYGGVHGSVLRIQTTTGDFSGSLETNYLLAGASPDPGLFIAGDLDADVTFLHSVSEPITIGDKLIGDLVITDSAGLDEQVIINADNNVYTNWTDAWVGDVIVNGTTVSPGDYTNTNLGDGAIGLARFTIHEQACNPAHNADLTAGNAPSVVRLVHYGRVELYPVDNTISHVKVDRRTYGSNGAWTAVSTHYEVDTGATGGRVLALKPKAGYAWDAGYEYMFTHYPPVGMLQPIHGYLKCDAVAGKPALLSYIDSDGPYVYTFKIQP